MSNKVKGISLKSHIYYFFDDIINIKTFDLDNIKIDKKLYRNVICYSGYVTIKDWKCIKINNVNPFYLKGYFQETNKSNYLTLVPTSESKEKI